MDPFPFVPVSKLPEATRCSEEKFSFSVWPLQVPVPVCSLLLDTICV